MNLLPIYWLALVFFINGSTTGFKTHPKEISKEEVVFLEDPMDATETTLVEKCKFNNIPLYGKVKFVESFADIKIKFVESFPDIKVKFVSSFPNECGKWQVVESFPDFTVQIVESFPDIKVKSVDSFPGIN